MRHTEDSDTSRRTRTGRLLAVTRTGTVRGVEGLLIRVEVDLQRADRCSFRTVGLADTVVREAQLRVQAALRNSGFYLPSGHVVVNLAPAGVRKEGAGFDLAVALGILAATGVVPRRRLPDTLLMGELALDGSLRPVPGGLPVAWEAAAAGMRAAIVPPDNAAETAMATGIRIYPASSLQAAADLLAAESSPAPFRPPGQGPRRIALGGGPQPGSGGSRGPDELSKSPRPGLTTSCSSDHREAARPSWPESFRICFPSFRSRRQWTWRGSVPRSANRCPALRSILRSVRRTTRSPMRAWRAADRDPVPER